MSTPSVVEPRVPRRLGPAFARIPEQHLFLILAIVIGVMAGSFVVAFQVAIGWLRILLLGSALNPTFPRVIIAPTAVGVIVALLVIFVFPRVRGSGVNQTKAALYIYDGYIPFNTVIGKFVASALAIAGGHSLGPEDPSLQIGAGLASLVGRKLRLSRERVRLIAPVGAAAGLAAAFNAPITAVLFVIEEVIGSWSAGVLGAVILSAVSAAVVSQTLMESGPIFRIPSFELVEFGELLAYAALGVVSGLASVIMAKFIGALRPRLKALPPWTQFVQPALAGLAIGIIGIWHPQVMGAGYVYIDQAMHAQFTWQVLAILAGLKILATSLSFSSGTPGGMFAPTLFIGAFLGASVGTVQRLALPAHTGPIGAYALVGMGTLFAGFLRAPMTSVFMILEISGNYGIVLPAMVSNTIAYLISRALQPTPIFEVLTHQDGLDLPSMEEIRERKVLRVEDAMRPALVRPLAASMPVIHAYQATEDSTERVLLVYSSSGNWYGIDHDELRDAAASATPDLTLSKLTVLQPLPHIHPDQPLDFALRKLSGFAVVPVVHRADVSQLVGVLALADVLAAYGRSTGE